MKNYQKISLSVLFLGASAIMAYSGRSVFADDTVASRVKGKIVLQVEDNGEAWYVNPSDLKRYYLGRPSDAFDLMRELSIGITNADLSKIPVGLISNSSTDADGDGLFDDLEKALGTDPALKDTDRDGHDDYIEVSGGYDPLASGQAGINSDFSRTNAGKIFLQVEAGGAAWYVNPADNKRYFLSRPADAFNVMRKLGLGIKSADLATIEMYYDASADIAQDGETVPTSTSKEYSNADFKYSLTYPDRWRVKAFSSAPAITQITDAKLDFYSEHKGVIAITYMKQDTAIEDVSFYRIASKSPSKTLTDEAKTVNDKSAYENSYQHKLAYEKTTTIKVNDKEFVTVTLTTTNDKKDYYGKIYDEMVASMRFNQ